MTSKVLSNNSNSNLLCSANSSYKKQQGYLTLNERALTWSTSVGNSSTTTTTTSTSNISKGNDIKIATSRMSALFCSKEGGSKVMIKVTLYPPQSSTSLNPPEESYSFTFTSNSTAISDREQFKVQLSTMIQINRTRKEKESLQKAAEEILGVSTSASRGNKSTIGNNSTSTSASLKGKERATTTTTTTGGAAEEVLNNPFKYKREVLSSNPSLAELHRTLVIGGMISESEFWEGREDLLLEVAAKDSQLQGKSGRMVDPKPIQGDGLDYTVKITNELMKDIFAEYPSVLQAFNDNVPQPLDITEFWTRYFQSKLFNRNRTTNRAAVNTVKDDAIFDLYLGEEDDDIEPKNMKPHDINRLLDLAATEEDQHEIINQADITMRAGGERASLPLMRRFNEHSERLLNQSLGITVPQNRIALDPGNAGVRNYYEDIVLEDLNNQKTSDRIVLNMHQPTSKSTSSSSTTTNTNLNTNTKKDKENGDKMEGIIEFDIGVGEMGEVEMNFILERTKREFLDWEPTLGEFETNQNAMDSAVEDMMNSIRTRAERSNRGESNQHSISQLRLSEIITLQTSSNEFLRQFWSAVLPPKQIDSLSTTALTSTSTSTAAVGTTTTTTTTKEMKAAKAERMKSCLDKTEFRIQSLLNSIIERDFEIDIEGEAEEERRRVEAALLPVREAVKNALEFYNSRVGGLGK